MPTFETPPSPLPPMQGENSPRAKLTRADAEAILRRSLAGESYTALAREFGVTRSAIGHVSHGNRWKSLSGPRELKSRRTGVDNHLSKLTENDVRAIRKAYAAGVSYRKLAAQYGMSVSPIFEIVKGTAWKHVE